MKRLTRKRNGKAWRRAGAGTALLLALAGCGAVDGGTVAAQADTGQAAGSGAECTRTEPDPVLKGLAADPISARDAADAEITDFLPGASDGRLALHGRVVDVQPGRAFGNVEPAKDGDPDSAPLPYDSPKADWRTMHLDVDVLDRLGNPGPGAGERVRVGLRVGSPAELETAREALTAAESFVFFLYRGSAVYAYDPELLAIAGDGNLLTQVRGDCLSLPGFDAAGEDRMLGDVRTLSALKAAAGSDVPSDGADGEPGRDGQDGGGDGADGGDASSRPPIDDAVASAPAGLRACLTRNDGIAPWRGTGLLQTSGWHREGKQRAHARISRAVYGRIGVDAMEKPASRVLTGFLGYDLDPVGGRLMMQIDPAILDVTEFRRWVRGIAREANERAKVTGGPLTVTVQEGCFGAREIADLQQRLMKSGHTGGGGKVALDGRVHARFCDEEDLAYATDLQREVGPILAIEHGCPPMTT